MPFIELNLELALYKKNKGGNFHRKLKGSNFNILLKGNVSFRDN